ncbi:prolipoprotein diacylglyceryl transferase [Clostridium sp. PL3]|uniref:Phosphatidylglycerol--prolipoprotein diacylglyceryl transferase n=1 Tax=Clostridium thailandense TaxID=2794346 RepID=A0A949TXJ6_9CLOT|nr:prolipoprotein diacylglyceryl transferase [Clostridium thailandense]MBV7274388.1 prolipoprotein diacylglyceryl transferase [Clostridium thailandense]
MHPILFKLGSLTLYSYGFMIAIGIISALLLALHRAKRLGFDTDAVMDLGIYGVVGGFIGAKLLFWIVEFPSIIHNPNFIVETLSNGFVVFGGIMGGALTGYAYCKIKKLDFLAYLDLIVPAIALAQGFGRIGCFEAGCCYGRETDSVFGIVFQNSLYAPNGVLLIPTQLFSSAGDFIIAGILLYYSSKSQKRGQVSGLYMILYSVGRFIIEIFRGDPRGNVGILSTSQFICIFMFFVGIYVFCFLHKGKKHSD